MTIKVGVLGAGNIATSRHIPAFQRHEDTRVVTVYDRNDDRTEAAAAEYDLFAADGPEAVYRQSDLVSICTPPSTHLELATDAMRAGCHVLCEKPMAMTEREAEEMISVSEAEDRVLSVVHSFLYKKSIRKVDRLIDSGELGTVLRTYMLKPESTEKRAKEYLMRTDLPGDESDKQWKLYRLFWDEAAHLMYLTRNVLGDITLSRATVDASPVADYAAIRANFSNDDGAEGNVVMLLDAPISEWWFVVIGDQGIALVDLYRNYTMHFDREPDHSATRVLRVLVRGLSQAGFGSFRTGLNLIKERKLHGYRIPDAGFSTQIDNVIQAIRTGSGLPVPPTEDRKAIEAMEAVVEATPMTDGRSIEADRSV